MSAILGHSHPEIVAVVTEMIGRLDHLFSAMLSRPVIDLAEALAGLAPGLNKVLLVTTGAESNEAALRLAKMATGGWEVVGFAQSWHGMTGCRVGDVLGRSARSRSGSRSARWRSLRPTPTGPVSPTPTAASTGAPSSTTPSTSSIARAGALAAFIAEPLLSSGGSSTFPPDTSPRCRHGATSGDVAGPRRSPDRHRSHRHDVRLRERDGIVPDILTLSKTLGAGLPLAAVLTTDEIEEQAHERGFLFYTTHVADPLPAAVGLKVIEVVVRDRLVAAAGGRRPACWPVSVSCAIATTVSAMCVAAACSWCSRSSPTRSPRSPRPELGRRSRGGASSSACR